MTSIVFFDAVTSRPYDTRTLEGEAIGGVQGSISRVANALGAYVVQMCRTQEYQNYLAPGRMREITHVIVNRDPRTIARVRDLYPRARVYLWVHDRIEAWSTRGRWLASHASVLRDLKVTIVCVSNYQRRGVEAALRRIGILHEVPALTIYNPVDERLVPDSSPVDDAALIFFSSPNKGLNYALDAFRTLRRRMPDLRLLVANPGYKRDSPMRIAGVEWLGALSQECVHAQVRRALCTFCPNISLAETFGLIFAESHALGTPVLTHDFGAAAEVIGDSQQIVPVTFAHRAFEKSMRAWPPRWRAGPARLAGSLGLFDPFADRVRAWRAGGRPRVGPDPRFRLSEIAGQWRALLRER